MPKLSRRKITKENKKHGRKFLPKYRAFNIIQKNIEDVVKKSTLMWKLIYGLTTVKAGEEDSFEGRNNGEEEKNDKEGEVEKEKEGNTIEEGTHKNGEVATVEE